MTVGRAWSKPRPPDCEGGFEYDELMKEQPAVRAGHLMAGALRDLFRPPFLTFLLLGMFVQLVFVTIPVGLGDPTGITTLLLLGVTLFIDIATTLAAGADNQERRADPWIKAALRRRCFWRYVATTIITAVLIGLSALALLVGAIFAGAVLGMAQPSVVLERQSPGRALQRSAELSRLARKPLMLVFTCLVLLPQVVPALLVQLELSGGMIFELASFAAVIFTTAGIIAMTRAFVVLGGEATPSLDQLLASAPART